MDLPREIKLRNSNIVDIIIDEKESHFVLEAISTEEKKKISFKTISLLDLTYNSLKYLPDLSSINIEKLFCGSNKLRRLQRLPRGLSKLWCSHNELKKLPRLPKNLTELHCNNNTLTKLPKLPEDLEDLRVYDNKLRQLPSLPKSLKNVMCSNNFLKELPVLPEGLEVLSCFKNRLKSLPKLPESLQELDCGQNDLTVLILTDNLQVVNCMNNPLEIILPSRRGRNVIMMEYTLSPILQHLYSNEVYPRYQRVYWKIRDLTIVKKFIRRFREIQNHKRKFRMTILAIECHPEFSPVFESSRESFIKRI